MKKLSLSTLMFLFYFSMSAQSWLPNNSNSMSAVNLNRTILPMSIGIGTFNPTAVLHTVGGLRFEGVPQNNNLTRIMAQDNSGNLAWRDASSLGTMNNSWNLRGNAGTDSNLDFIGTTDVTRFVFRTNNVERATILSDGKMGIGLTTPRSAFEVSSSTADNHVVVSGTSPSVRFNSDAVVSPCGRIGAASVVNDFTQHSIAQDFIVQNLRGSLIFGTGIARVDPLVSTSPINGVERARFNSVGNFGINTRTPTALLHVDCTNNSAVNSPSNVRFQHLPIGNGEYMVVDANGNVFRQPAQFTSAATLEDVSAMQRDLAKAQEDIVELKRMVQSLSQSSSSSLRKASNSIQIIPNPFLEKARVKYNLENNSDEALLLIMNENGQLLKQFKLQDLAGELEINDLQDCGMIICNIVSKGKVLVSEKSIKIKN